MIVRLTAIYVGIFAAVLAAISAVAYELVGEQYRGLLAPALSTPEGQAGYATAMHHVALTIGGADIPVLVVVGVLAYVLARLSLRPLIESREREKQFAADAAHEMRSPLAIIASVAQAARLSADTATHPALDSIAQTALEASALIADLLTLARDPRPTLLQCEPVDLAAIVVSCSRELEPRASERGLVLVVRAGTAIVNGDERRLRELVRNLLENAMRHGRTQIEIESTVEHGEAVIRVVDDGDGVDAQLRDRIFERFVAQRGGTGLGLAISQWVTNAHGGKLALVPSEKGATFVARLPATR